MAGRDTAWIENQGLLTTGTAWTEKQCLTPLSHSGGEVTQVKDQGLAVLLAVNDQIDSLGNVGDVVEDASVHQDGDHGQPVVFDALLWRMIVLLLQAFLLTNQPVQLSQIITQYECRCTSHVHKIVLNQ
jgi:hypothetical protein